MKLRRSDWLVDTLDLDLGSSLMAEDAKQLAAHLDAAADISWLANRAAFPKATVTRPEDLR